MNKQLSCFSHTVSGPSLIAYAFVLFAAVCFWAGCPAASAQSLKVAMDADHWQTESGAFEKIQGMDALALHTGEAAAAKGVTLRNGTIEFDVQPLAMGAGLAFRQRDNDTFESLYIRPNGKCSDDARCLQYAPQTHGILLWDLFPQYQASAPIRDGEWNHVKVVLSGRRMNVYVNHGMAPALKVGRLEGDTMEGNLLLAGPGYFANFTVTLDATESLAPEPEADPGSRDPNLIRNWQLSPATELAADKSPSFDEIPAAPAGWQPITAEGSGLVNISRQYGLPIPRPRRSLAWLKTTITSDRAQTIHTSIGWVREVWVFVNGKPVYSDKNLFMPPAGRKNPDGRCAVTNGSFELPLDAGNNEVAIAVASGFYGWAVIVRPDEVKGLQLNGLLAQNDPFVGKWKFDPSRSRLTDVMKVESAGEKKYLFDFGSGNAETIVANGTDQPGIGGTTFAVTVVDSNTWRVVRKKDGRTIITATWELSKDGKTLTDHFTSIRPDGSTFRLDYVYKRTAGYGGFAATWESVSEQVESAFEMEVQPYEEAGLSFISPAEGTTRKLKFDGKDYPVLGSDLPANFASSGHRIDARTLELTDKLDGKVIRSQHVELSPDLKILTMTVRRMNPSKPNLLVFERE